MKTLIVAIALWPLSLFGAEFPQFMTGHWQGTVEGVVMEEQWLAPSGGLMLGVHRDVRPDGKASFEFLRVEMKDGRLTYLAMPGGQPPTPFPLKTLTASRVVFENLEHDFPQRIIYWLDGKRLCARVEGNIGGSEQSEQWCWTKRAD